MSDGFEIREATPADLPAVVELEEQESLRKYPNSDLGISREDIAAIGFGEERVIKYQQRFCLNSDGMMWVAQDGDEIIGFCAVNKHADQSWIRKLYVRVDHQGRGVGTQLLHTAQHWLGTDKAVMLGVASYDNTAKSFYLTHGYVESGLRPAEETTVPATGKIIPETLMIKTP